MLERPAGQQIACDVVEPQALPEPMELSGGFQHIAPARPGSREDEPVHGVGKPLVLVGRGDVGGPPLHVRGRIAHGDAQAAPLEHQHVARLVADRRDGLRGDLQISRQPLDDGGLGRGGMGHIEVVRLRPRGRDLRAEHTLQLRFTCRDSVMVVADADDLDDAGEHAVEGGYHGGLRLRRRRFAIDARGLTGPHVPVRRAVDPHVETVSLNGFHDRGHNVVGQPPLVEHGQIGEHDDAAVEGRHRHRQAQRLHQHPQAPRRPPAADGEDDAALAQPIHRLDRALGQQLVLRDQRAVDVSEHRRDWMDAHGILTLWGSALPTEHQTYQPGSGNGVGPITPYRFELSPATSDDRTNASGAPESPRTSGMPDSGDRQEPGVLVFVQRSLQPDLTVDDCPVRILRLARHAILRMDTGMAKANGDTLERPLLSSIPSRRECLNGAINGPAGCR